MIAAHYFAVMLAQLLVLQAYQYSLSAIATFVAVNLLLIAAVDLAFALA